MALAAVGAGGGEQTLVLEIGAADLEPIRGAQLRILLARASRTETPVLVWQSLEPFEFNTVTWRWGEYGIYAATVAVVPGARVTPVSVLPEAQASYYYSFPSSAVFQGPFWDAQVGPDRYGVQNAMPYRAYPQLTFGLQQAALVNGVPVTARPVTAETVLANRMAIFAPVPVVYVWLTSGVASSTIIAGVGPDAVAVDCSSGAAQTLIYDPELGRFVPRQSTAAGAGMVGA